MIIGVPKESYPGERRVALVPASVPVLRKAGTQVLVQSGAGEAAGYPDAAYREKGADIAKDRDELFARADVLFQVLGLGANPKTGHLDLPRLRPGMILIGFLRPLGAAETIEQLAKAGVSAFAVELMPRITRAQSMDALSSMATVSGYKAVVLAADRLPKLFPMMMTAASTLQPARVLVLGAGVAGLQAIATARKLGGVVYAYDIRPAVKEQVLSLGARFVELPLEVGEAEDKSGYAKAQDETFYQRQRELLGRVVAESDVVITTASVPGRKAPVLVTEEMVRGMRPGSIVIDLAAERGGNCALTRPEEEIEVHGVTIVGAVNLASTVPLHASQMYSNNLTAFFLHLCRDRQILFDEEDEITRETLVVRNGEIVHPAVRAALAQLA